MTKAPAPTGHALRTQAARTPERRAMLWIVALQIGFALFLFSGDIGRALPRLLAPSTAPALTKPVAPGDQTRRFAPRDLPARSAPPGSRPLPAGGDMPTRLLFEDVAWQGAPALMLTGEIAPGDAARLADHLARGTVPATVFLDSPGGSVADALAIGRSLRALGVATRISAADVCLSACPYILAAGTTRTVDTDAWVGVHQHYFGENTALPAFLAVADIQRGQGEVMGYLIEMGIDPGLMQPALLTPPDEIYLLLPEELAGFRLVTPPAQEG